MVVIMKKFKIISPYASILISAFFLSFLVSCQAKKIENSEFTSASTVSEIQNQIKKLPSNDIWWTVNGKDMSWNFKNLNMIFPTVTVHRNGPVSELKKELMPKIAEYKIDTPKGMMRFDEFLKNEQSTTMGVVIMHQGNIVFEQYPRMEEYEKPIYWSTSKIFPATLIRILEERGKIDVNKPIDFYIPRMKTSSFAGTSVRHILDMASGLDCSDEYESWESCYYLYSMSIGDGFRTPQAPDNPYLFASTAKIEREAPPGHKFSYSGLNTFILSWLVEEITNMPFQDAFTKEIWYHIGAEADAAYIAPRYGIPITHGGFISRMRDLARFGLLFTPSYKIVSNKKIISDSHLNLLRFEGDPNLLKNSGAPSEWLEASGIKHNIYQWDAIYNNDTFYKGGWAGQGLIVNPTRDTVAVFTSYFKDNQNSEVKLEQKLFEVLDGVFGYLDNQ